MSNNINGLYFLKLKAADGDLFICSDKEKNFSVYKDYLQTTLDDTTLSGEEYKLHVLDMVAAFTGYFEDGNILEFNTHKNILETDIIQLDLDDLDFDSISMGNFTVNDLKESYYL